MLNDYTIVQRSAENMHTLPTVKRFKRNLRVLTTILIITSPGRLSKLKLEVSEILPGIACLKPFQDKIDPPTDKMLFINWWVYLWQKTKKMIECTPLAKVQQFEGRGVHFYQGGCTS